jgi:hypothetical protein
MLNDKITLFKQESPGPAKVLYEIGKNSIGITHLARGLKAAYYLSTDLFGFMVGKESVLSQPFRDLDAWLTRIEKKVPSTILPIIKVLSLAPGYNMISGLITAGTTQVAINDKELKDRQAQWDKDYPMDKRAMDVAQKIIDASRSVELTDKNGNPLNRDSIGQLTMIFNGAIPDFEGPGSAKAKEDFTRNVRRAVDAALDSRVAKAKAKGGH